MSSAALINRVRRCFEGGSNSPPSPLEILSGYSSSGWFTAAIYSRFSRSSTRHPKLPA